MDSNFSVFIFVEARDALMSSTQYVSFYLVRNTLVDQVWMSQPRHVFCLASQPSTGSFHSERRPSRFSVSEDCSCIYMVWMTNKDDFLTRSVQLGLSMVMFMVPSINPSIEDSFV